MRDRLRNDSPPPLARPRERLNAIFAEVADAVASCLQAALAACEVPTDPDRHKTACFIVSSHQAAILLAKAEHSPAPISRFAVSLFRWLPALLKPYDECPPSHDEEVAFLEARLILYRETVMSLRQVEIFIQQKLETRRGDRWEAE
jgi:hypothetical protein